MVKIKMNKLAAGPDGVMEAGKIYSVEDKEASQLVKGRYAELIEEVKPEEPKEETDTNV